MPFYPHIVSHRILAHLGSPVRHQVFDIETWTKLDDFLWLVGEDGCLEEFENTADFSRDYQARQDCMCDEEHMFTCPTSHSKVADMLQSDEADMMDFSSRLNKMLEKAVSENRLKKTRGIWCKHAKKIFRTYKDTTSRLWQRSSMLSAPRR